MYRNDALQDSLPWPHEDSIHAGGGVLYHVPCGYIQSFADVLFSKIDEAVPLVADRAQIKRMCEAGDMGIYVSETYDQTFDGMMILQLLKSPEETVLRVVVMWGQLGEQWVRYWPSIKQLARNLGANAIEGFGRKGFERWGKAEGLAPVYTLYRAEV